jgi:osmotically-inducible protein OsmY
MLKSKSLKPVSVAMLLGALLIGCATPNRDDKITAKVRTAIDQHSDLGAPGVIRVQTLNGVVYLSGLVDSSYSVENAESVARAVNGVTNVVNNVSVDR